jgi:methyl-accepting chemotaxis protein
MFSDLFHSKNAPAALILVFVGLLLAVLLPSVLPFPGWAAGIIGLMLGGVAGVLAMQGRGANRDDLLALRTGIMAAVRGERATRPTDLSPELAQVFAATDELAAEVDGQKQRNRASEAALDGLRGDLARSVEGLVQTDGELLHVIDSFGAGFAEHLGSIDRVADSLVDVRAAVDELLRGAAHGARLSEQLASISEHAAEALGRELRELVESRPQSANTADPQAAPSYPIAAMRAQLGALEEVAEQADLLALNAEIKAAQAGESGKGFGGVADDIRELVERLGLSIREITALVTARAAATSSASERLVRGTTVAIEGDESTADKQARLSVGVERALRKLVEGSKQGGEDATKAARDVVEQARRTQHAEDETAERIERLRVVVRDQERRLAELRTASQHLHRLTQHDDR